MLACCLLELTEVYLEFAMVRRQSLSWCQVESH